jgi:hypothetical protein
VRRAGLAAGLVVAVAACSGGHRAVPPTTTAAPSTTTTSTTLVDAASVQLPTVPGETTVAPVEVTPGPASVNGSVVDDTGAPVGAAIVNLQRIVGGRSASTQVTSASDGTWSVHGVLGGVYRIRAWRAPDLAQPSAAVVFVSATAATPPVALTLAHYTGTTVQAAVSPNPPLIGAPVSLVVQVTSASVGADGVVRQVPLSGSVVSITASGDWAIDGAGEQVVGASGQAAWQATCETVGPQAVAVSVDGAAPVALNIPACAAPATTTSSPSTTSTTAAAR